MADKLTASQLDELGQLNVRVRANRTATIDNDSISSTDITDLITKWGKTKFEVYNKHPADRGKLRFPVVSLEANNSDGYFDLGGTAFPNGASDLKSTSVRVEISIDFEDGTTVNVLDFTGQLREPEIDDSDTVRLVVEHPLTALSSRKWTRYDRIGGDTGVNEYFY